MLEVIVEILVISNMHWKKKIQNKVYALYLKGVSMGYICNHLDLSDSDAEEIIDYMNEIYL